MSVTKKFFRSVGAVALTGMLLAGAASAGPGGHGGPGGRGSEGMVTRLSEKLSLSPDQQTQVRAVFDRHFAQARAAHEAREASMTPEQRAAKEAKRQEWKAKREAGQTAGNGQHRQRGERPPLTPEQQARWEQHRQQMQAQRQQMEAELQAILTPEQRQLFEQMKAEGPGRHRQGGDRGNG